MNLTGTSVLVTGGASGLGAATAQELARAGARVAVLDINLEAAQTVAAGIGGLAAACDVTDTVSVQQAIAAATRAHGPARVLVHCAGIVRAGRVVSKDGSPMPLEEFAHVVHVNLIGTFNIVRLVAADMVAQPPLEDGERGVIVTTASIAAFDGQIGQEAYSASKGGVAAMTLALARDLAQHGVRVVTIAPGIFQTPMLESLPPQVQQSLADSVPFPKRLGKPEEYAQLARHIAGNRALNGEVIRLDGALRMPPR